MLNLKVKQAIRKSRPMREFTKTVQQGNRMFGLQESDANNWLKQKLGANIISARLRQI